MAWNQRDFFELILDWFLLSAESLFRKSLRYGMESQRLFRESLSSMLEFNRFYFRSLRYGMESQRLFRESLSLILVRCRNLTDLIR